MENKLLTSDEPQGIEETEEVRPSYSSAKEDDKYQGEDGKYYQAWRGSREFEEFCEIPWRVGMTNPDGSSMPSDWARNPQVGMSILTHSKQWNLMKMAKDCLEVQGEYWECGVYAGGSATILGKVLAGSKKKLRLFDTFTGVAEKNHPLDHHNVGDFEYTEVATLKDLFSSEEDLKKVDVSFEVGIIPDSLSGHGERRLAFVHIDLDQHDSVLECLKFIWPMMTEGGVVVLDDYGVPTCKGARKAIDTYCNANSLNVLTGMAGQAYLFKKNSAVAVGYAE